MTDQFIKRWECPECDWATDSPEDQAHSHARCLGPGAWRTYVAIEAVLALPQFLAIAQDREGFTRDGGWPHADPSVEICIPVRLIEDLAARNEVQS